MSANSPIFIITGTPGAGKTSVARELLQRCEFGIHIPLDDLREWVVSGIAHPLPVWTDETTRQFRLAYEAAASLARIYAGAGFAVAIEQVIYPKDARRYLELPLSDYTVHKIFLQPHETVALERNASRTTKDFDTSFLNEPIPAISRSLAEEIAKDGDWLVVDSSGLSLGETVDEILRRISFANLCDTYTCDARRFGAAEARLLLSEL